MMIEKLDLVTDKVYPDFLAVPAAVILFKIVNCQKCNEFEPIVLQAAQQFGDRVKFGVAKLHVPGACREIKRKYRFESFPTTHFYKQGELVHQEDQKLALDSLQEKIQGFLL